MRRFDSFFIFRDALFLALGGIMWRMCRNSRKPEGREV